MKAQQIMTRDVRTVRDDASLADAARTMWDSDCGFVPVVDSSSGEIRGVITDRDICMGAMTQGRPIHEIPVTACMSRDVLQTCAPDVDLKVVQDTMRRHRIRRLPIVDAAQKVVGVISLNDMATRTSTSRGTTPELTPPEIATTLGRICEHHNPRQTSLVAEAEG
jgi:CBS domain-containing protein